MKSPHKIRFNRQFTLLEIMVALGVMAIGMTAALGLLTAATTTGRRAENHVQASLAADYAFSDMQSKLTNQFNHTKLPSLTPEARVALAGAGETFQDGQNSEPTEEHSQDPSGPKVLLSPKTPLPGFEDYKIWGLVSPVEPTMTNSARPDPKKPRAFFAEVHVLWSFKGQKRSTVFHNILLRRLRFRDLPKKND